MHLLCFGFGYTARALAARLLERGWTVSGTTREEPAADDMLPGVRLTRFDGEEAMAGGAAVLAGVTHVLISIPPGADDDRVQRRHHGDLASAAENLRWAGYLSTTGVYGDHEGGWVDETTPLAPTSSRARARVDAEAAWARLARACGLPLHIFRLAGIYGPGRNALEAVLNGTARRIVKPGQVFGRIHVADAARVLAASMAAPAPGAIYNLCDDEPAPPQDVIAHAARLLNRDPPREVAIEKARLSAMAASFYRDNKRVGNDRIKRDLGVTLRYPTYRDGLQQILAGLTEAGGS